KKIKMLPSDNFDYNISGNSVLVLEGAVEQGNLNLNTLIYGIRTMMKDLQVNKLYVKFHPAQTQENKSLIIKSIKDFDIEPISIPDEIAFEQIILTNNNLKVYGFTTSLLFYAYEYGCKVKSYEQYLENDAAFK